MKKTLFVALVATVALLATSCKKAEAPKASFSYENDGLVVSFTNLSKNADTYKWEFGDGQTSTETNPKHTYAENGKYTVTLTATGKGGTKAYSEEVVLKTAAITIDGNFADWDAVIAAGTAAGSKLETGVEYPEGKTAQKSFYAYADADFFYFYVGFDATQVMPLDILIGTNGEVEDENPCTSEWDPIYVDYLLEFGKGDQFEPKEEDQDWYDWSYNVVMQFNHEVGGWDAESFTTIAKTPGAVTISQRVAVGDVTYIEGKVSMANFTVTKPYLYVCSFNSNSGWGGCGYTPCPIMDQGSEVKQGQIKVMISE